MTFFKLGLFTISTVSLMAGCSAYDRTSATVSAADGLTYQEMRAKYDGLSAVEFSIIDTNNDYVVDADEEGSFDITPGRD